MKEIMILRSFIESKGIRRSKQRERVLEIFLQTERHLTVQELNELINKEYFKVGVATVYRTMKLACEAGLAREIDFGDGNKRYEHLYGHEHHDHLICIECGSFEEIKNSRIEEEQKRVAERYGYDLVRHRHILYGICPKCKG